MLFEINPGFGVVSLATTTPPPKEPYRKLSKLITDGSPVQTVASKCCHSWARFTLYGTRYKIEGRK